MGALQIYFYINYKNIPAPMLLALIGATFLWFALAILLCEGYKAL